MILGKEQKSYKFTKYVIHQLKEELRGKKSDVNFVKVLDPFYHLIEIQQVKKKRPSIQPEDWRFYDKRLGSYKDLQSNTDRSNKNTDRSNNDNNVIKDKKNEVLASQENPESEYLQSNQNIDQNVQNLLQQQEIQAKYVNTGTQVISLMMLIITRMMQQLSKNCFQVKPKQIVIVPSPH